MKSLDDRRTGWHDFRFVLRRNVWVLLIGLGIFLLLIPFSTAGLPGSSIFNIEVTHDQLKFRLFHPDVIPVLPGALVFQGFLTGVALFRFVLDKKETTIFFTLGITRRRLFGNRAAAGVLMLALAVSVPMGLSCFLNVHALGLYEGLLRNTVYLTLGMLLMEVVSFLLAAISVFAAGTLAEACVYWSGLMALPTVLCCGLNALMDRLSWGSAWGRLSYSGTEVIRPSLVSSGSSWNPVLFLLDALQTHGAFLRPPESPVPEPVAWSLPGGWGLAAIGLVLLAALLLRKRPAELAGITAVNPVLSECIILLSGFGGFAAVFSLLSAYDMRLAAGFGVLTFLAVHLFWRKTLFAGSLRHCFHALALGGAALGLCCLLCAAGQTAYTSHFLGGEVLHASVTYVGAPGFLYEEVSGSSTGRGYYVKSELNLETPDAIDTVKALHSQFQRAGASTLESGETDTVIPYDVCFSYEDTSGREHTWYYDRCSYAQLEALLSLEDLPEVRARQAELFHLDDSLAGRAYSGGDVYLTSPWLTDTYQLTLSDEQRTLLLDALSQDAAEMSLEDRYFPQTAVQAVLMFTDSGQQDTQYFTYHLNNEYLYLSGAYPRTLAWLRENELLTLVSGQPEAEYIVLQRFDPYVGMNGLSYPMGMYFMAYCADTSSEFLIQKDFGKQYTITEPEKLRALLSALRPGCYMTRGGFLAAVKLSGEDRIRYLFLPEDKVPDFVAG